MGIQKSDLIVRTEVINKFYSILNTITITFSLQYINKSKYITNVSRSYDHKKLSSTIIYWPTLSDNFKLILECIKKDYIDAEDLILYVQKAFSMLSQIRNARRYYYDGDNNNGQSITYTMRKHTLDGLGCFANQKTNNYLSKSLNVISSAITEKEQIKADNIIKYFNALYTNYLQWRNTQSLETIKIYFCHTNCHSSCYTRSRR